MHTIEVTKIVSERTQRDPYSDNDDVDEGGAVPTQVVTSPCTIFTDSIRCFYPRRADKGPGTRITFRDGGGFAVTETYEEMKQRINTH